jgi:hypothetical protein
MIKFVDYSCATEPEEYERINKLQQNKARTHAVADLNSEGGYPHAAGDDA